MGGRGDPAPRWVAWVGVGFGDFAVRSWVVLGGRVVTSRRWVALGRRVVAFRRWVVLTPIPAAGRSRAAGLPAFAVGWSWGVVPSPPAVGRPCVAGPSPSAAGSYRGFNVGSISVQRGVGMYPGCSLIRRAVHRTAFQCWHVSRGFSCQKTRAAPDESYDP